METKAGSCVGIAPMPKLQRSADMRWYLIHCKPREDGRALENLERQGFECFWPTRLVERRRHGRQCTVAEALFPRYLFVRLDCLHDNWNCVRSTRGVQQIVRFTEYPTPVRDEIVEGIRDRLKETLTEPYLRPGERVCIAAGAFSQVEAIFIANDSDERVVLLLDLLHKDQRIGFPVHSVRKLG